MRAMKKHICLFSVLMLFVVSCENPNCKDNFADSTTFPYRINTARCADPLAIPQIVNGAFVCTCHGLSTQDSGTK